jgi:hypothetical protein
MLEWILLGVVGVIRASIGPSVARTEGPSAVHHGTNSDIRLR